MGSRSSDIIVSVVTPFYNTEDYLAECIESVLAQSFDQFEYILADNRSTDRSFEIAEEYARKDPRIKLVKYEEHLDQLPNYNRALRLTSDEAEYCKVAQADDVLLPECLAEMVKLADTDDEIVMVGAYTILQNSVFLDGLDFYETVVDGGELCRRYLLGGPYIFGSPTTCMYRMAEIKKRPDFYPGNSKLGDADIAMEILNGRKFGFVHRVLSFVRTSNDSISGRRAQFHFNALSRRVLFEKYGHLCLNEGEMNAVGRRLAWRHYRVLGEGLLLRRPAAFWELHREALTHVGLKLSRLRVTIGAVMMLVRWVLNLEGTFRREWHWS